MKTNSSKTYYLLLNNLVKQYRDNFNVGEFTYLKTQKSHDSIFDTLLNKLFKTSEIFLNENFNKEMNKINPLFEIDLKLVKEEEFLEAENNLYKNLDWIPLELLTITINNFDYHIHSFYEDLIKNKKEIEKILYDGKEITEILEITSTSTSAFIVKTNVGTFVYKKHDCRNDVWFHDFLNQYFKGYCYSPKCFADSDLCGFCEYIATQLPTKDEINTFSKNLGVIASISRALGLSDLHGGNIIPVGPTPVIVDLETLFKPLSLNTVSKLHYTENTDSGYFYYLNRSVLGNTIVGSNSPFRKFSDASLDSFIEGFSFGYDKLFASKKEILKEIEVTANFHERHVLRKHDYYQMWVYKIYSNKENKYENRIANKSFPNKELICKYELSFLKQGIDPYFYSLVFSKDLYGTNGQILVKDFFTKSSLEMLRERFELMSEENKQFEIKLIQRCFEEIEYTDSGNDIDFIDYWDKRSIVAPNGELFWLIRENENSPSITSKNNIIAKRCAQIAAETCDKELKQRAERLSKSNDFIVF